MPNKNFYFNSISFLSRTIAHNYGPKHTPARILGILVYATSTLYSITKKEQGKAFTLNYLSQHLLGEDSSISNGSDPFNEG